MRSLRFIPILLAVAGLALWARSPATGADTKEPPARPPVDSIGMANAAKIYKQNCELCHGKTGNGDGVGAAGLNPKPRKFTDPSQFKSKDDNGVFNDGGLILKFPDHVTGLFFRSKTQFLPTDARGNRIPGVSKEIPPATGPIVPPPIHEPEEPQPVFPAVYLERALVNPAGDDPRKEVVVIGNTTTSDVDLTGWSIVDRNDASDALAGVLLPAGASVLVILTGRGAQLSNKGGTIRLMNPSGVLVHAVSYSKADAVDERYIRFNT